MFPGIVPKIPGPYQKQHKAQKPEDDKRPAPGDEQEERGHNRWRHRSSQPAERVSDPLRKSPPPGRDPGGHGASSRRKRSALANSQRQTQREKRNKPPRRAR